MKKGLFFSILIALITLIAVVFANQDFTLEAESYKSFYSTSNAPIFYGATEITIDKNVTDEFNIKDSRFRIFAKDFEDGDLTFKIICEFNNVEATKPGDYEVKYSVTDSHKNKTEITVPVHVLDKTDSECRVVRTLYTIPSLQNLKDVGTERCNTGDRQILGIFLPENASAEIKILQSEKDLEITFFTNTRAQNSFNYVKLNNSDYQTIKNVVKNVGYASVPLITSPRLDEKYVIDRVYKIEIKFDDSAKPLDYYHYKDDEEEFKNNWKLSENAFGIVDGEAIMCVVPFGDVDKLSGYTAPGYNNPFESLDKFFEYYLEVVNRMDKMIGLEFDAKTYLDQNYRTKYTAVADSAVSAGAYYAGGFIAVCQSTIAPIFQYGWGTLHEIAHGYQGSLGKGANSKGSLYLNETGNNILAHYIQMDKSLYLKSDNYLGDIANAEQRINTTRLQKIENGETIFNNNNGTYTNISEKMYCIINLLDNFEGYKTYGKLFSYYRKLVSETGINGFSIADVYAKFFAEEYNANIIPYLKAWKIEISEQTELDILKLGLPSYSITADVLSDESYEKVKQGENLKLKYGLISDDTLKKYELNSNLKINIEINDFNLIKGKNLALFDKNKLVQVIKIESQKIEIKDLNLAYYELKLPVIFGYDNKVCSIMTSEGDNEITYTYNKLTLQDYSTNNHLTEIKIYGIYGTVGYTLSFNDFYSSAEITYGGADLGNRNSTWQNKPDEIYISVTIKDASGNEVDKIEIKGNHYFSDFTPANPTLSIQKGYKICVYTQRPNLVKVFSKTTGNQLQAYMSSENNIEYLVTENGLKLLNAENFDEKTILYNEQKSQIIQIIEDYKNNVTMEEIQNKRINSQKKAEVINAYNSLSIEDQSQYTQFINQLKIGGIPKITLKSDKISINKNENLDLYSLITIYDNEDFIIEANENNVKIETNLDNTKSGKYVATYKVKDSDNNINEQTIEILVLNENSNILGIWLWVIIGIGGLAILTVLCSIPNIIRRKKIKK